MVHALLSVPDNVPNIVSTLEMRYGRPDVIIQSLVSKVTALPPVGENRHTELLDFAVTVQNLVTTIANVNAQAHLHNPSLMTELVDRLPPSLRLPWGEQVAQLGPTNVNLEHFSKWLTAKANALSFVMRPQPKPTPAPAAATALVAVVPPRKPTSRPQSTRPLTCVYCDKPGHYPDECKRYATVADRKEQLNKQRRCYLCLSRRHTQAECDSTRKCAHCQMTGRHHRSLCQTKFGRPGHATIPKPSVTHHAEAASQPSTRTEPATLAAGREAVRMQTAIAQVAHPRQQQQTVTARILFDSGSYRTYITEALANKLQLHRRKPEQLQLATFGNAAVHHVTAHSADLTVHFSDNTTQHITATVVPTITGSITTTPLDLHVQAALPPDIHLADHYLDSGQPQVIDLLVGNDYYLDIVLPERRQLSPGLYALNTRLGWIISGRLPSPSTAVAPTPAPSLLVVNAHHSADPPLDKPQLERFWDLETIGITDSPHSSDDDTAHALFQQSVSRDDGRYMVRWPWKPNHDLPDNYTLAKGRLTSLLRRLRREPDTLHAYDQVLQDQQTKGIIEKAPPVSGSRRCHYLPHHHVSSPGSATTKLRIVYDGSAKTAKSNNSLNDCLFRGPVLLQDLAGILLRFRMQRIAITADIEKAFLQISLHPTDRDVTRFLWLKSVDDRSASPQLQEYRFTRVPFGVVSSPFLLAATVNHHLQTNQSVVADTIRRDLYVDNLLTGTPTVPTAVSLYQQAKSLFASAHMNLRCWNSNSDMFRQTIPAADLDKRDIFKVLGLIWNRLNDTLAIPVPDRHQLLLAKTKREVLHGVAATYDPLGLFSPVTIRGKLLLQALWKAQREWDDQLDALHLKAWSDIVCDLSSLSSRTLPRYVGLPEDSETATHQLLCFSDASASAYAAAVYLRSTTQKGVSTSLVSAKTAWHQLEQSLYPVWNSWALCWASAALPLFVSISDVSTSHQPTTSGPTRSASLDGSLRQKCYQCSSKTVSTKFGNTQRLLGTFQQPKTQLISRHVASTPLHTTTIRFGGTVQTG